MRAALVLVVAAACSTATADLPDASPGEPGEPDQPPPPPPPPPPDPAIVDLDGDGLDDARELAIAADYMPFISLDPTDGCKRSGLLVRVRKHPMDPTKVLVVYDHLFERDCGISSHVGDDEVFAVAIDPTRPAPAGILAIKTASHQGSLCERVSECSTCGGTDGRPACDLVQGRPVIYPSRDKHGQYATRAQCPTFGTCLDLCTLATQPHRPPLANAGEPGKPLVSNLTTQGFINPANGWTEAALMNVDPWAPGDFGGAGSIADDLVDPTFVPAPCR
jgi:hypothetical protein